MRDDYLEDIFASLDWLALDWDSGPRSAEEFKSAFSQRLRLKRYQAVLDQVKAGGHFYACACSREQIKRDSQAAGVATYAGTCRALNLSPEENAWRHPVARESVKVRDESGRVFVLHPHRDPGDFVLRRKNGEPSYQVASLTDDEDLNINFIVRGLDLMPSTGAQLGLAHALGWNTLPNARFWHHALMVNDASEKLSKSDAKANPSIESLKVLRAKFPDPVPVLRFLARHMHIDPTAVFSVRDLIPRFRIEAVDDKPLRFSDFWRELGEGK